MGSQITRRQVLTRTASLAGAIVVMPAVKIHGQAAPTPDPHSPMFVPSTDVKWERIPAFPGRPAPTATEPWPEIAILRVDPSTQATQLMIRVPKNFHVPKHWHTANETHTIVTGTFIMECEGRRAELGPGSFNYMPSRMVHEAWTRDEGTLLFITVDSAWDVNFVEGGAAPSRNQ
jgi:mannose-6-phosphate isomerase-like protein (cupin superfamily)